MRHARPTCCAGNVDRTLQPLASLRRQPSWSCKLLGVVKWLVRQAALKNFGLSQATGVTV